MNIEKYIKNRSSFLTEREDIEWSNFWIDRANTKSSKRILLIGDSTSRMIRSTFSKISGCPVDLLATSSALHDELFINQINAFFNQSKYKYETIFVQLGHHAVYNKMGGDYEENDYLIFEKEYSALIDFLKQFTSNIILESILLTVVPYKHFSYLYRKLRIKEKEDVHANYIKIRKNEIIKKIAIEKNMPFCDISSFMQKTKYVHKDHIHYEKAAMPVIVQELIKYIV